MTDDLVYQRHRRDTNAVLTDVDVYIALQDVALTLGTRGKSLNDFGLDTLVAEPPAVRWLYYTVTHRNVYILFAKNCRKLGRLPMIS